MSSETSRQQSCGLKDDGYTRSYVLRQGRLTPSQTKALDQLLPTYSLPKQEPWDFQQIFQRSAPTVVEIGFGMGKSLAEMAHNRPQENFIGIEVHRPGVGALLNQIDHLQLKNLRIYWGDAILALKTLVCDQSLERMQIFFPDPWPKKRHHKRRLIQQSFVQLVYQKLKKNGLLHIATDWQPYADHILEQMGEVSTQFRQQKDSCYNYRPTTKYEARGKKLGHAVTDLIFYKF